MSFGPAAMLDVMGMVMQQSENKRDRKLAQHQFDQQMDWSVRRRVRDAKLAGIHPLFALGANISNSPTMTYAGGRTQNQLAGAADRLAMREAVQATIKKDEAEAAYFDSLSARVRQQMASEGRDGGSPEPSPWPKPQAEQEAAAALFQIPILPTTKPGDPSTETGVRSPYVEYRRRDGSVGTAFGAAVPGAEEINTVWIPLQNWWHTSKVARDRLRQKFGITTSKMAQLQKDPKAVQRLVEREGFSLKRFFAEISKYASGRPVR